MYIGAHLAIHGGIHNCAEHAAQLEINCMQIFTKNHRQWFSSKLKEDEIDEYLENVQVYDIKLVFSHASNLLNLSAMDKILLDKSQRSFLDEINRAEILNLVGVVFHPGTYYGNKIDDGIKTCAESLNFLIENTRRYNSKLIMELSHGAGKSLGFKFEQLAKIIELVENKKRIGICIDTAHAFEAGYNIKTTRGYAKMMEDFDDILGLEKLMLVHLNDTAKPCGSRVDKHANLGEGMIGKDLFYNILHDKRLKNMPFIIETPGDLEGYHKDLDFIKELMKNTKFQFPKIF